VSIKPDVLIPARNEARTVAGVVSVFRHHPEVGTVYVVDNASTDDTGPIAARAGAEVITCRTSGKGEAVTAGLKLVTSPRVIFCDADLIHLTPEHVSALAAPYRGMTIGVVDKMRNSSGQRSLPTELARITKLSGWGMERDLLLMCLRLGIPRKFVELDGCTQWWFEYILTHKGALPPGLSEKLNHRPFLMPVGGYA